MTGALPYFLPIIPVLARHTVCDTPMPDRASYRSHNALNSIRYDCQSWLALGDGSFGDSD